MELESFFAIFGKAFVFKKVRPHLKKFVMKAGYNEIPYSLFGILFYVSILITYIPFMILVYRPLWLEDFQGLYVYSGVLSLLGWFGIQIAVLAIIIMGIYLYFDLRIFNRTMKMEAMLADYLQLVSTNLRGGMSFEKSLWSAISPHFSILSNEISLASKKVLTGYDLDVALQEFSDKYDSPILKRTIGLIIGEIKSGGKIADLIDKIINDLKETEELKRDMAASVISYMIFIAAIVIVISPGLFALSYQLLIVITGFASKLSNVGDVAILPNISAGGVDAGAFKNFSMAAISVIALFSSMIVSILEKGTIKGGAKYIPFFIGTSLIIYHVLMGILQGFFGSLAF